MTSICNSGIWWPNLCFSFFVITAALLCINFVCFPVDHTHGWMWNGASYFVPCASYSWLHVHHICCHCVPSVHHICLFSQCSVHHIDGCMCIIFVVTAFLLCIIFVFFPLCSVHHIYRCMCIIFVVGPFLLSCVVALCRERISLSWGWQRMEKRGNWTEGRIVNIRWRWTKKFKINLQSKVNAAKEFKLWVIFFGPDWLLSDILDPLNPMISFRIKYPSLILHFSFFCLFWP